MKKYYIILYALFLLVGTLNADSFMMEAGGVPTSVANYPTRVGTEGQYTGFGTAAVLTNFTIANAASSGRMVVCGWSFDNNTSTSSLAMASERGSPTKLEEVLVTNLSAALFFWTDAQLPASAGDYTITGATAGDTTHYLSCTELSGAKQTIGVNDHDSWSTETDGVNPTLTFTTPVDKSLVLGLLNVLYVSNGNFAGTSDFVEILENSSGGDVDLIWGYEEVAIAASNVISATYSETDQIRSAAVGVAISPE